MSSEALFARGLEPGAYTSREFFDAEQRLWESCWVVLGYATDVRETDSFLTGKLGQLEVVVQRFSSGLSAFVNRCAHRHMCLQQTRTGRRSLSCPYHGWRYGADGRPTSMPMLPKALLEHAQTDSEFHLKKLHVEERYGFVWVNASTSPESLDDFLGPEMRALLQGTSELLEERFHQHTETWAVNWKLAVESGVEGFHVGFVHPESLRPLVDVSTVKISLHGRHSLHTTELNAATLGSLTRYRSLLGLKTAAGIDLTAYVHILVFPSLAIGISGGTIVSTQFNTPSSPDGTELNASLWQPRDGEASPRNAMIKKGMLGKAVEDSLQAIAEDRHIAEAVQRNMRAETHRPVLALPAEARLSHFHRTLQEAMK